MYNIRVNVCKQDPNELFLVASSREKRRKAVEIISVFQTRTGRSHRKTTMRQKGDTKRVLAGQSGDLRSQASRERRRRGPSGRVSAVEDVERACGRRRQEAQLGSAAAAGPQRPTRDCNATRRARAYSLNALHVILACRVAL